MLEDVPEVIDPTSIILEVVQQIEDLKAQILPLRERDEELRSVIRKLGRGHGAAPPRHGPTDRMDSCSHTLETLVRQLQSSLENEEALKVKIAEQKSSFYHLKLQLTDQKSKNQKLEQDIDILQAEIEELKEKNQACENNSQ